jgi:hypothetical protein
MAFRLLIFLLLITLPQQLVVKLTLGGLAVGYCTL